MTAVLRLARAAAAQLAPRQLAFTWRRLALRRHGVRAASWRVWLDAGARVRAFGSGSVALGDRARLLRETDVEAHDAPVVIGARFFMNKGATIVARHGVSIGDDCLIGEGVAIHDHDHRRALGAGPFGGQGFEGAPVRIGTNVWIGAHAFVGPGVSIGDDVVIGANAVIVRDVPSGSVAVTRQELVVRPLVPAAPGVAGGAAAGGARGA